jgi:hypothetical protein
MPTCLKCGKDYELGKQDKALRRMIGLQARVVPVMKDTFERAKDCCNECFKAEFKMIGQAILGTLDQVEGKKGD